MSEPAPTELTGRAVLERTFSILYTFDDLRAELSLAELARSTGLPKATVYRLCGQLVHVGALERTTSGYRIGIRLFELGTLAPRHRRLREAAQPFIEDLHEVTRKTVHFGILDGLDIVYLERLSGHRAVSVATRLGGRLPAYCTGLGKSILAFSDTSVAERVVAAGMHRFTDATLSTPELLQLELSRIRASGVAFDRGEYASGVWCAAAPVFNRRSVPIASISVTSAPSRQELELMAPAVRATSLALSRKLHAMPDSYWSDDVES